MAKTSHLELTTVSSQDGSRCIITAAISRVTYYVSLNFEVSVGLTLQERAVL